MILENFKLTIISEWTELRPKDTRLKKNQKPIAHRTKVGSVKIDYGVSAEAAGKLVDVLHDDVFEQDCVKIDISATSNNY
tara:strand:- start:244 stop:483 length:240 start_codon:yes stop_codon:yes gene_type:complete